MTTGHCERHRRIGLSKRTLACVLPTPRRNTFDWLCKNLKTKDGVLFSPYEYPWTKGICDRWDDPAFKLIYLQFAARLGKTLTAQGCLISSVEHDPSPAMFGSSTESLVKETLRDKLYPMLEQCPATRSLLPPKHRRLQTRIDLAHSVVYTSWAGSPTTLADKDPRFKHAGEIDKWVKDKSDEADPLALFLERGSEIVDGCTIAESTPTITGRSRVNRGVVSGTNERFHVPCPHCGTHQQLVLGDKDPKAPGLKWDRDKDGRQNPSVAFKTARYQCIKCGPKKPLFDHHKRTMNRNGVWCPRGQSVNKRGKLVGKPEHDGPIASFQLSRLYAPTFSFGDIAYKFVTSYNDREEFRNFQNSWLGETWDAVSVEWEWDELGERLGLDYHLGTIPADCVFLTCGVDVQVDHLVFVVIGWAPQSRGYVIDYGTANDWTEMKTILRGTYPHSDGGPPMHIGLSLVDARDGNRTDEVFDFCRSVNRDLQWVWPSMGSKAGVMGGKSFRRDDPSKSDKTRQRKKRRGMKGFYMITVNTTYWQQWIQSCIERRLPGDAGSLALPHEAKTDQDFLEQLLNEVPDDKTDSTGHAATLYIVANTHLPWDFRDCVRYARCAAECYTNGNWNRVIKRPRVEPSKGKTKRKPSTRKSTRKKNQSPDGDKPTKSFVRKTERSRFVRKL